MRAWGASPLSICSFASVGEGFPVEERRSFYRMLSYADFHSYFERLHTAYSGYDSLEDTLQVYPGKPMEKLCRFLEVSYKKSAEETEYVPALDDTERTGS